MNMKKISALLVAAAVSVTLFAGCGSNNDKKDNTATNNTKVENKEENKEEENKEENTEEVALQDGTFKAEKKDFDERGWKTFTEVTVKDGKIEAVVFDYVNEAGDFKSKDEEYNKNMEEKSGIGVAKAIEELTAQMVEKQNVEEVEAVTGATSTSEEFKTLVNAALEAAKEGKAETIIVE